MRKRQVARYLGVDSWYCNDDIDEEFAELLAASIFRHGTYGARYLDGWVVKATR